MDNMEQNVVQTINDAVVSSVKDGFKPAFHDTLFGWNSPFRGVLSKAAEDVVSLKSLIQETVDEIVQEPAFKAELKTSLRKRLVGELVKSFNLGDTLKQLRSNPEASRRIVSALEAIAEGKTDNGPYVAGTK